MKMIKGWIAVSVLLAILSVAVSAKQLYSFGNISISQLEWTSKAEHRTENKTKKNDFSYLEVEGGAGYDWGEVYGFVDFEEWNQKSDQHRWFGKGNIRINLADTGFHLFTQIIDLHTKHFDESNYFLGLGKSFQFDNGIWLKTHLASRYTDQGDSFGHFKGNNGYQLGATWGYDFTVAAQNLSITQWHEYDFARGKDYLKDEKGNQDNAGHNGAVATWWHVTDNWTLGLQYRYADDHLGETKYQDAYITSVRYNF